MSANNKGGQALKTAAAIVGAVAASGAAGIALAYAVEQWQEYQVLENPMTEDDLKALSDSSGTVKNVAVLSARVSRGGVTPELRCKVWPILLGVPFAAATSPEDRKAAALATQEHYESLQARPQRKAEEHLRAGPRGGDGGEDGSGSASQPESPRTAAFSEAARIIGVDVPRTPLPEKLSGPARPEAEAAITRMLLAFAVEEPDVGYCQGMSEVAAVFLHEFSRGQPAGGGRAGELSFNEAECYASLAHFLFRFRRNFLVNSEGILGQLRALGEYVRTVDPQVHAAVVAGGGGDFVFVLRPLALLLMRELGSGKVAEYWDVLLAASDGPRFHIVTVAAALLHKRWSILHAGSLDQLLLIVNNLAVGRPDAPRLTKLLADGKSLMSRARPQ